MSLYRIELPARLQRLIAESARGAIHAKPVSPSSSLSAPIRPADRPSIMQLPPLALLRLSVRLR